MPPIRLAAFVALAAGLACTDFDDRANAAAFERYTRVLLTSSDVSVERCAMHPGRRSGTCLLRGAPDSVEAFLDGLPLVPHADSPAHGPGCQSHEAFGRPDPGGTGRILKEGGRSLRPDGPLPPNRNNVHLRRVVIDPGGGQVCIEYEFPYG